MLTTTTLDKATIAAMEADRKLAFASVPYGTAIWYWPEYLTDGNSVDARTVGCAAHEIPAKCPGVVIGHEAGPRRADGEMPQLAAGDRIHIRWLEGNGVRDAWVSRVPADRPARGRWWPMEAPARPYR